MTDGDWREELGEVCEGEESLGLTSLSEEKLGDYSRVPSRRVLQGRTDLVGAEFVHGGGSVALSPEELARVLLSEGSSSSTGGGMFYEPMS